MLLAQRLVEAARERSEVTVCMTAQTVLPSISDDLKSGAVKATIFALIAIFLYIFIRFRDWRYSLGTIIALLHDVFVTLAVFSFLKSVVPFPDFEKLAIRTRAPLMGEWFLEGDLGFVFAPRGVGKTWFGLALAVALAEGRSLWTWTVPRARRVLYVDGEMAYDAARQRIRGLVRQAYGNNLLMLHHEQMFQACGQVLNLSQADAQTALLNYCVEEKCDVLVLDNLSCLFSGIKENDADAWEMVLPWLLNLRRRGISVVFIHHAGRNGMMRGTSRREDAAFWVVQLSQASRGDDLENQTRFISKFTKNRNTTDGNTPTLEWTFTTTSEGKVEIGTKLLADLDLFRECVENGLMGASDIAEEMKVSKGQVSKLAKKAMAAGWLVKDGRDYRLVAP